MLPGKLARNSNLGPWSVPLNQRPRGGPSNLCLNLLSEVILTSGKGWELLPLTLANYHIWNSLKKQLENSLFWNKHRSVLVFYISVGSLGDLRPSSPQWSAEARYSVWGAEQWSVLPGEAQIGRSHCWCPPDPDFTLHWTSPPPFSNTSRKVDCHNILMPSQSAAGRSSPFFLKTIDYCL